MSRWKPTQRARAGARPAPAPSDVQALADEAERLLRDGHAIEAEHLCHALLATCPHQPTALMIVSVVCLASGRLSEAEVALRRGAAAHPRIVGFHTALGRLLTTSNRQAEALVSLENCVLLAPENREYRVELVALYQSRVFTSFSEASRLALISCLMDDSLTHSLIHRAWLSLVRVDPELRDILSVFDEAHDFGSFRDRISVERLHGFQEQPLFQLGLDCFLVADLAIERGLTFVRRWCLENPALLGSLLPLVCQLSRYCYFSEYVFEDADDWSELHAGCTTADAVALLGCYAPLERFFDAGNLPDLYAISDQSCYREVLRVSLEEPLEERRIRPTIAALTAIDDDVSRAVQTQYEENPYPRWTSVGSALTAGTPGAEPGREQRILIAGCGTGREAVNAALNFPGAQVDAIDLSRASLAYGVRKARELHTSNLTFGQADLLNLGGQEPRYDWISAAGVLHHLRDPSAGLCALLTLLRPRGVLRVALYSRLAREAVAEARRWILDAGWEPTTEGIRAFRAAVIARAEGDPVRAWLTRSYDFYSLSQCRDLVFHVQEHDFTLLEIADLLQACGLSVLRVEVKSPVHRESYQRHFPEDRSGTRLEHWADLEALHPTMFAGMYDLWLCRTAERDTANSAWLGLPMA